MYAIPVISPLSCVELADKKLCLRSALTSNFRQTLVGARTAAAGTAGGARYERRELDGMPRISICRRMETSVRGREGDAAADGGRQRGTV